MPLTSNPDAIFLSAEDFQERFGFPKPGSSSSSSAVGDGGKEVDVEVEEEGAHAAGHGGADVAAKEGVEMKGVRYAGGGAGKGKEGGKAGGEGVTYVVFYCKAGVRSKAAMQMAAGEGGWSGVRVGHWGGGWSDWERRRESVER